MKNLQKQWQKDISLSYDKIIKSISNDNYTEASKEFKNKFYPTVKTLYLEAESNNPFIMINSDDWALWTEKLNYYSKTTLKAFKKKEKGKIIAYLKKIRDHYYRLRVNTYTMQSNDYIFGLYVAMKDESPNVDDIAALHKMLIVATPSQKAKSYPSKYKHMKDQWASLFNKSFKDCQFDESEINELRDKIRELYIEFGAQFI